MRDGSSKLAQERVEAESTLPSAQILQFRPREPLTDHALAGSAAASDPDGASLDDLAQYEQDRQDDETVNYPQRMLMNVIAVVIVTVLIGVGVWLADTIAEMERDQDCVLQGRQNCAPLEIAAPFKQ